MATINDLFLDDNGFIACKENQTSKEWESLITELFKDWQNLKQKDKYSEGVIMVLREANELLKAERSAAKSQGWDECSKEYDEHNITWCLWNINDRVGIGNEEDYVIIYALNALIIDACFEN